MMIISGVMLTKIFLVSSAEGNLMSIISKLFTQNYGRFLQNKALCIDTFLMSSSDDDNFFTVVLF